MTESEVYQRELGQARGAYVRNEFTGEEEIVMNTEIPYAAFSYKYS